MRQFTRFLVHVQMTRRRGERRVGPAAEHETVLPIGHFPNERPDFVTGLLSGHPPATLPSRATTFAFARPTIVDTRISSTSVGTYQTSDIAGLCW